MKELVLKIKHSNWSMMEFCNWEYTEWNIYNDLTADIEVSYLESEHKKISVQLTEKIYNNIFKKIELAKDNDIIVEAFDGSAWEFIQYDKGEVIWNRKEGYIYGIKPLEKLATTLNKLINQ